MNSSPSSSMGRQYSRYGDALSQGGIDGVKEALRSDGFSDEEAINHQIQVMSRYSPEFKNAVEQATRYAEQNKGIADSHEQQKRFLESVLPNATITPQSVADRRLEDFLFKTREGATIDDKGNMTDPGTVFTGLNIPQGTLPAPMSTITPRMDEGARNQLAFMQQARPGAEGNFGAATVPSSTGEPGAQRLQMTGK